MKLLHTTNFTLSEFLGDPPTPYAILSHTWLPTGEINFQDITTTLPLHKEGYSKLRQSCLQAALDGYKYIWIDTCCIDKTSSAELSENINSMYRFYQQAAVCYAYLSDVSSKEDEDIYSLGSNFRQSRWFTRGWTLQELIAPSRMIFFSNSWTYLGEKKGSPEFLSLLSDITGIDSAVLSAEDSVSELRNVSVARKMSWASKRVTTRLEDRAYSLIGIFNVTIPLLYGEGSKAFIRLQEEIAKETTDESLFAWQSDTSHRSLLATSPDLFAKSADILLYRGNHRIEGQSDAVSIFTNSGLQVDLLGCECRRYERDGWLVVLNCWVRGDVLARPAIFFAWSTVDKRQLFRFHYDNILLVHQVNGKAAISSWAGGRVEDRRLMRSFHPAYQSLTRQRIFDRAQRDGVNRDDQNPFKVWFKGIKQKDTQHFSPITAWPAWDSSEQSLQLLPSRIWNESLRALSYGGALTCLDLITQQKFVVFISVKIEHSQDAIISLAWTAVEIKSNIPLPLPSLDKTIHSLSKSRSLESNGASVMVLSNRFMLCVRLATDEFLGRREISLSFDMDIDPRMLREGLTPVTARMLTVEDGLLYLSEGNGWTPV